MKCWLIWIPIVLSVAFLGGKGTMGTDVAKLRPVEVLWVQVRDGIVSLKTDTGDFGAGKDLKAAVEDLKKKTSGEVFLETTEYLLLEEKALELLPELDTYLRPSCMVCLAQGDVKPDQAGVYLKMHHPKRSLAQYIAGEKGLETLQIREGRMELVS